MSCRALFIRWKSWNRSLFVTIVPCRKRLAACNRMDTLSLKNRWPELASNSCRISIFFEPITAAQAFRSARDHLKHDAPATERALLKPRRFGWMKRSLERRHERMTSRAFSSLAASAAGTGRRSVRGGERTRILSVRRLRREEIKTYESA